MPLEFQNVDVKFNQGLSTKTTPKGVIAGKWQRLENLGLTKDFYLQRRDGIGSLATGARANGNGVATHNNELLTIFDQFSASVSTATTPASMVRVNGSLGFIETSASEAEATDLLQDSCDCASGGGYTCYVWRRLTTGGSRSGTAQSIRLSIVDEVTGTRLLDNSILLTSATCANPRVVYLASPSSFMVFYGDTGSTTLFARCITLSSPTTLGAQFNASGTIGNVPGSVDACSISATTAGIAYRYADGVTSVRSAYFINTANFPVLTFGPTNVITQAVQPTATIQGVCICAFSSSLVAVYANGSAGLLGAAINGSCVLVTAPAVMDSNPTGFVTTTADQGHVCACLLPSGSQQVYADNQGGYLTNLTTNIRTVTVSPLIAPAGAFALAQSACFAGSLTAIGPRGPFIYGKPFVAGASFLQNAVLPVVVLDAYNLGDPTFNPRSLGQQSTIFVLDINGNVVSRTLAGSVPVVLTHSNQPTVSTPCSVFAGATTFSTIIPQYSSVKFYEEANDSLSGLARLDYTPRVTNGPIFRQLTGSTIFSGGALGMFDGSAVVEQGFNLFPEGIRLVNNAASGSMTAGVHQVVAVYEWIDGAGERHQSAPGLATSITTALNDSLTISIPTLMLTQKNNVTVVPYITAAAGTTFYRGAPRSIPTFNTTAATSVAITFSDQDSVLTGNELLYNQPDQATGTLANDPPPPSAILGVSQNRLWGFNGDGAKGQFFYSQQYQPGVGLQFSNELTGVVPMEAGAGVAVAPLDDKTVLLCANKPCVIFGAGPNPDGTNNGFSAPQTIQSDVGCSEARSVLSMPLGLIFKSLKGWYLLGRDLSVKYIGEAVAAYDAQNVSSATLLKDRQECRFTTTSGATLVYSYLVDQWSATTAKSFPSIAYSVASALYWDTLKAFVSISTTQGLNIDTPGQFFDNINNAGDVLVATTARTAWLKLQSLNGFQRIQWLYLTMTQDPANPDQVSSTFSLVVDYDDFDTQAAPGAYTDTLFSAGAIPIAPGQSTVDIRTRLHRQKCKSVAFTFIETPTDITGTLLGMQALTLRIGQKQGTNKLASTNTAA